MDFTPKERARYVVRYLAKKKGVTQAQIGELLGYSNKSSFSSVLSGEKPIPKKFGEKLAALDPDINPDFLNGTSNEPLMSGGELPFTNETTEQPRQDGIYLPGELVSMFTDLSATVRAQHDTLKSQQETIRMLIDKINTN